VIRYSDGTLYTGEEFDELVHVHLVSSTSAEQLTVHVPDQRDPGRDENKKLSMRRCDAHWEQSLD
jgi:hypothetical protein